MNVIQSWDIIRGEEMPERSSRTLRYFTSKTQALLVLQPSELQERYQRRARFVREAKGLKKKLLL